jgi:hypothetical protein
MSFGSDQDAYAAVILLHELAHRAGVLEEDNYENDDEKTRKAQERNNAKLYENCLKPGE